MDTETLELAEKLVKQYTEQIEAHKREYQARVDEINKLYPYQIIRTWDKFRRPQPMFGLLPKSHRPQNRVVAKFDNLRSASSHLSRLAFRYKAHDFKHQLVHGPILIMES